MNESKDLNFLGYAFVCVKCRNTKGKMDTTAGNNGMRCKLCGEDIEAVSIYAEHIDNYTRANDTLIKAIKSLQMQLLLALDKLEGQDTVKVLEKMKGEITAILPEHAARHSGDSLAGADRMQTMVLVKISQAIEKAREK